MIIKSVKFPIPVGHVDFITIDVTVKETKEERIWRRDLYLADDATPTGMTLIKQGELHVERAGVFEYPPKRYWPEKDAAA
ncbi:hypothetical protein [Pseudogemmobacter bohemicus]|uniref:hypothetical protein n=1 Tax=Pseudogemmobacter bohemicus TaxID=2250708 RepID=UPI000DD4DC49|nr:hypothetical protein [Pseudogemmobacter bohemicus]